MRIWHSELYLKKRSVVVKQSLTIFLKVRLSTFSHKLKLPCGHWNTAFGSYIDFIAEGNVFRFTESVHSLNLKNINKCIVLLDLGHLAIVTALLCSVELSTHVLQVNLLNLSGFFGDST